MRSFSGGDRGGNLRISKVTKLDSIFIFLILEDVIANFGGILILPLLFCVNLHELKNAHCNLNSEAVIIILWIVLSGT